MNNPFFFENDTDVCMDEEPNDHWITLPEEKAPEPISDREWFDILMLHPSKNFDALIRLGFDLMVKEGSIFRNLKTKVMRDSIRDRNKLVFEIGMKALEEFDDDRLYVEKDVQDWIDLCDRYSLFYAHNEERRTLYQGWKRRLKQHYDVTFRFCFTCKQNFAHCFCFVERAIRIDNNALFCMGEIL